MTDAPALSFFSAKPGRPSTKWLDLEAVAAILRVDPAWLAHCLDIVPNALPGASWADGVLSIKQSDLMKALGLTAALPEVCSVDEAAKYLGKSPKTVYEWLNRTGPKGEKLLRSWKHAGVVRIPVVDVLNVPAKLPSWAAPSFFCGGSKSS
jgi:hypothetical protein